MLIFELKSAGAYLLLASPFVIYFCSLMIGVLIHQHRSRGILGTPEMETLMHDLRLTIWGRVSGIFWILLCVVFLIFLWRYPDNPVSKQNKNRGILPGFLCRFFS